MLKNKRIFISGGAGVIGQALVRNLSNQGAVILVGDLKQKPAHWDDKILYRQGDLNYITKEELEEFAPEYFFHLAATFERSVETLNFWDENIRHNVRLSQHLMTCLKDSKSLKRVVYASSYLIYSPELYLFSKPANECIRLKETDPINPRNLVGMAKLMHEMELNFLANFSEFSTINVRIYRVYGRNSRDIISRWVRSLLKNEKISVYRKEGIFDFILADDVAEGLARLAACNIEGVINLGRDNARPVSDVVNILKKHFPDIQSEEVDSDIPFEASQADMSKFKMATNWAPSTNIEDGIVELIKHEKTKIENKLLNNAAKNILVTSISKKVSLLNNIKDSIGKTGHCAEIHGSDLNEECIGRYFVDSFWKMPRLDTLSVDDLILYCKENKINSIIPTRDGELAYFAKNKEKLSHNNITVMVSDITTVANCIDKLKFAETCHGKLPVIQTSLNIEEINSSSFVVKERFGAGAKSVGLNLDRQQAIAHAATLDNPIFQPYITGTEISIDAYISNAGNIKGVVCRSRDCVVNGESQITTVINNPKLEELAKNFIKNFSFYGHIVLQVIIDNNNQFHIVECNSRFGGASSLSVAHGMDSLYWFLLEAQGVDISSYPFVKHPNKHKLVRFAQDKIL
jgi:carbamoyl-phosphate synthase large subunit